MRRALIVVAASFLVLMLASQAGPPTPEVEATSHVGLLPDLQTLPPRDIEIVLSRPGPKAERRLRFDNRIWNAGAGPLEAQPVSRDCDGDGDARNDRLAVQRIFSDSNGSGAFDRSDALLEEQEIGCMVFHPRHKHWHIEDFATYELYQLVDGEVTGPAIRTSTKVSFCMIDTFDHDNNVVLSGEPAGPYYTRCGRDEVYGISVGWGDEYQSTLADQWIVINGVADGDYCLVSTANPSSRIVESDYTNNAAGVRITIEGNTVTPRNPNVSCVP